METLKMRGQQCFSGYYPEKKKSVFPCIFCGVGWQEEGGSTGRTALRNSSLGLLSLALGRVSVSVTLLVFSLSLTEGKQFEYVTTVYLNVNFMQFMMTNAMQYFMIYKP